jgi:hypothetical protein
MREATIVALFDNFENAEAAVGEVVRAGTPRDRIALLANDSRANVSVSSGPQGARPSLMGNPAFAREEVDAAMDEQSHTAVGVEVGLGLGGVLGLLVGVGTIAIPGIGPLIAAGTLATVAAGAVGGGVIGGAIGALTGHGISDKDAHLYAEGLRRGGTLVTVRTATDAIDPITQIFKTHGAVDIEKRGAAWIAEGWLRFDAEAQPLSVAELAALHDRNTDDGVEHHHHVRHYFHPDSLGDPVHAGATTAITQYGKDEAGL